MLKILRNGESFITPNEKVVTRRHLDIAYRPEELKLEKSELIGYTSECPFMTAHNVQEALDQLADFINN